MQSVRSRKWARISEIKRATNNRICMYVYLKESEIILSYREDNITIDLLPLDNIRINLLPLALTSGSSKILNFKVQPYCSWFENQKSTCGLSVKLIIWLIFISSNQKCSLSSQMQVKKNYLKALLCLPF